MTYRENTESATKTKGGRAERFGWLGRLRPRVKGLFQRILPRLRVLSSEVKFQVEKQEQTPKKRAIIGQELRGVRYRRAHRLAGWKSRGDGCPPGCPGGRSAASSPHSQCLGLLEPSREPGDWGGAISSREGNSFQDLKPRDSEASDSDYQQSNLPFCLVFS